MSKRFGRNQKRKMQQQIEVMQMDMEMMRWAANKNRETVEAAKGIINTLHSVVPNSVCIEDAKLVGEHHTRHALRDPVSIEAFMRTDEMTPDQAIDIRHIDLFDLETDFADDRFSSGVHFLVDIGGRQAGYRISQQGLHMIGEKELKERICGELTRHIKGQSQQMIRNF